jgi:serine O-acetyltransferase
MMDALVLYRLAHRLYRYGVPLLPRVIQNLNFVLTRCVVPYSCELGRGTELGYGGIAVVIHGRAVVGRTS